LIVFMLCLRGRIKLSALLQLCLFIYLYCYESKLSFQPSEETQKKAGSERLNSPPGPSKVSENKKDVGSSDLKRSPRDHRVQRAEPLGQH
jgi:hypothetical protein